MAHSLERTGSELGVSWERIGSELGASWEPAGSKLGARGVSWGMLYYVLGSPPPLWGQEVRGAPSSLPSLPAHSPCSPCFQLNPLTPRASLGPWNLPGTSESPQLALRTPSSLPSLPVCSPCSQTIPGSLKPFWGLRKPQLTPLAPRASLGLWNLPRASGSPQLAPLTLRASLGPWSKLGARRGRGASWEQGEWAGSEGSKLTARGVSWEQGEQAGSKWSEIGVRGVSWDRGEQAGSKGSELRARRVSWEWVKCYTRF